MLFLGLPQLIYFFFTSFYSHGFTAWFLGLPRPFDYIFTPYNSYELISPYSSPIKFTTLFLGLPWPIYFFFTSCYFHGPTGYQSYHIGPLGLLPNFFYHFASHFLLISLIVGLLMLLGLFSKMSINIQPPEHMDCSCNSYENIYANFFCKFFKQWTLPCFLFCHEQACLFEFTSLAVILKHNLHFI